MPENSLGQLSEKLGELLLAHNLQMCTAESCTGGLIAATITDIPGSSAWFDRGYVTYSNESKQEVLGVSASTIQDYGAVSEQTVAEMLTGLRAASHAQVGIAVSGLAGPGGGSAEKPVGTVCIGWFVRDEGQIETMHFDGDRDEIRKQTVIWVMQQVINKLA